MTLPPSQPSPRWKPFTKLMVWLFSPVALYLGFYGIADWEGAHALAETKARWEAKGESFDPHSFLLPPIPNDQNLATPLLQVCEDTKSGRYQEHGFDILFPDIPSIYLSRHSFTKLLKEIDKKYHHQFKTGALTDPIKQLDRLYPMWGELKVDSQSRSQFQINPAPKDSPPSFPFARLWEVISLGTARATIEIQNHHPDLAMGDLQLCFRILACANKYPEYRGQPVVIKSIALISDAVEEGILTHAWNDEELSMLQNEFASCDELVNWQLTNRGELARIILLNMDAAKSDRRHLINPPYPNPWFCSNFPFFYTYWPNGWFDSNSAEIIDSFLTAIQFVDCKSHRVYAGKIDSFIMARSDIFTKRWLYHYPYPWEMLPYTLLSEGYFQAFQKEFPSQALVDEAQIACALERYYLVHHIYPKALQELIPIYAKALPNDPFGGAPYKYSPRKDGTYLLYSIGWNEKDDGGTPAPEMDPSIGDYVWGVSP